MRKSRQQKIYLKAFSITNSKGRFTEDDFKLFKEKFEIVKKLYFNEEVNHEYFDSFRTISKELKRAAHNAGLELSILNLEYKSNKDQAIIYNFDIGVTINLIVAIKSASKFGREYSFVVTDISGLNKPHLLIIGDTLHVPINDDMKNEDDISYHYKKGDYYGIKYIHRCLNS